MPNTKEGKPRYFNIMSAEVDSTGIRHETFRGVDHLVVPIVALVEGVIQGVNAIKPELALASEFGKFPVAWNGRPVTINHPQLDDNHVSASSTPALFEKEAIGFLFNSHIEDKKLKTEAWIDLAMVANSSQLTKDTVARLETSDPDDIVEVSTGLFTMTEEETGRFNQEEYNAIWRDVVPDHLAILEKGVQGACSVRDGCGARMNTMSLKVNCECKDKKKEVVANKEGEENVSLERINFFKSLKEKFTGFFTFQKDSDLKVNELSDRDNRTAILSALTLEDAEHWYDILAVFSDSFVYCYEWNGTMHSRSYSVASDGVVALGSEKVRVRPETTFVPVNVTEKIMTNKAKVDALIANSATPFEESDREWLSAQNDEKLAALSKQDEQVDPAKAKKEASVAENAADDAAATPAPKANSKPISAAEYIAAAPAEIQEVLTNSLRMHEDKRTQLIDGIKANSRNQFDETELKAMSTSMLEKLANVANVPTYEGRSPALVSVNSGSDDSVPAAPKAFPATA